MRKFAVISLFFACLWGCSDDAGTKDPPTCEVGEVYNPVTGTCAPQRTDTPNNDSNEPNNEPNNDPNNDNNGSDMGGEDMALRS